MVPGKNWKGQISFQMGFGVWGFEFRRAWKFKTNYFKNIIKQNDFRIYVSRILRYLCHSTADILVMEETGF